jgi:thiamine biosynthesis lipoprotein
MPMTPDSTAAADLAFDAMGSHMRILVGAPARPGLPSPAAAAGRAADLLRAYDARLSRFRPDSELTRLNKDPREVVPASALLRAAVRAALFAAELTDGLVDPTLLDDLERAGYDASWDRARRLALPEALAGAPEPRRPATARALARWRRVRIDDDAGTIARPPGLRLDTGGSGKGHAADLAAELLEGYENWAVDCGGDVRIGGEAGLPRDVQIEDPFTGEILETRAVTRGAVATSGLRSRIWRGPDGRVAHHLLDPATGRPAFTGLVAATALAPTTVEAEARAKAALLSGPAGAAARLAPHGGLAVAEDGSLVRPPAAGPAPRLTFRLHGRTAA